MIALTAVTEMNERQLEIFCHCEKFFFDHEKPALVNKYAHYFTEGYDAFGISEEEMKMGAQRAGTGGTGQALLCHGKI